MRFKHYINERGTELPFNIIIKELYDKCYPFIKEINKQQIKGFIFSGRENDVIKYTGKVRKNRNPKDSPIKTHNILDKLFKKKFGWKARSNAIFCTGNIHTAAAYGKNVYMIFPIGKYKFLWSPEIDDLYETIDGDMLLPETEKDILLYYKDEIHQKAYTTALRAYNIMAGKSKSNNIPKDEWIKDQLSDFIDAAVLETKQENAAKNNETYLKVIHGYKNTDLIAAIQSRNEIMINCKEYIALKEVNYYSDIFKYMAMFGAKKPTTDRLELLYKQTTIRTKTI